MPGQPQDENKFLELQYMTLRKEIEDAKGRAFKILAGEAFAIPLAQFFIKSSNEGVEVVLVILPVLIIILVLRFIYENNSIIRCGAYIKCFIEPYYINKYSQDLKSSGNNKDAYKGWEEWLECTSVFNWNRISKDDNENKKLRKYLVQELDLDWAEDAEIKKINEGKAIIVSAQNRYCLMELNCKKMEVIMSINNNKTGKLIAKTENKEINIYRGSNNRQAEIIMKVSFYLFSLINYIFAVMLAQNSINKYEGLTIIPYISLAIYLLLGISISYIIFKFVLISTIEPDGSCDKLELEINSLIECIKRSSRRDCLIRRR
jgi:hypothetical protein